MVVTGSVVFVSSRVSGIPTSEGGPELSLFKGEGAVALAVMSGLCDREDVFVTVLAAVLFWGGQAELQLVAAPAFSLASDFCSVALGLRPRLPRAVRVLFPNIGLDKREFAEIVSAGVPRGVFALFWLLVRIILVCC